MEKLTPNEKKGLMWAGIAMLIFSSLLAWTIVPEDGILRNTKTGLVAGSPFLHGIVVFIFIFLLFPVISMGESPVQ
ncbi:p-Aminobenzoyl-glutamate transporter family (AbgT) [Rodentibacter pneumotropicus]|uniref:p-Aminobenzoyl-glutamate transporter family (AbgT) n=1 Tax=Rodentibacter pneumotropicus TaxID=758 RepID=A0A3S4UA57_9PAST|nr:p-Aminobenzoyl-glutamate transporter family (AbgT) [Rodentibacter pneumotropicus]